MEAYKNLEEAIAGEKENEKASNLANLANALARIEAKIEFFQKKKQEALALGDLISRDQPYDDKSVFDLYKLK